jgi:hypothetical protein
MTHTPKVIEAKQLNNEYVSYCVQCCGDALETTWHTMHVAAPDHEGQLATIKADVTARHELMLQWRANHP